MRWLRLVITSGSTSLAKPGSMPLMCMDRVAAPAGVVDLLDHLRRQDLLRPLQQHRPAAGDVDARLDERRQVLDALEDPVVGHRGVHDRVGRQRDQRVAVGGGLDAELAAEPGQLAGVPALLGRGRRPDADQLEVGVRVDARDRVPADGARRPDDDAQRLLGDDLTHVRRLEQVLVLGKSQRLSLLQESPGPGTSGTSWARSRPGSAGVTGAPGTPTPGRAPRSGCRCRWSACSGCSGCRGRRTRGRRSAR